MADKPTMCSSRFSFFQNWVGAETGEPILGQSSSILYRECHFLKTALDDLRSKRDLSEYFTAVEMNKQKLSDVSSLEGRKKLQVPASKATMVDLASLLSGDAKPGNNKDAYIAPCAMQFLFTTKSNAIHSFQDCKQG